MAMRLGITTSIPNSVTGSWQACLPQLGTVSVIMAIQASFFRTWGHSGRRYIRRSELAAPVMVSSVPVILQVPKRR